MQERRVLNTWKEIAAYLSRGVRTVQRWELTYRLPVHRPTEDAHSVFALADEIDAWMERASVKGGPYVRPTVIVLDVVTPGALSNLKLTIEAAKFNVLTAFTSSELFATAAKFDADVFVLDSVVLDTHPAELGRELRRRYPNKPRVLIGDDPAEDFDATFSPGNTSEVVEWLIAKFGKPRLTFDQSDENR